MAGLPPFGGRAIAFTCGSLTLHTRNRRVIALAHLLLRLRTCAYPFPLHLAGVQPMAPVSNAYPDCSLRRYLERRRLSDMVRTFTRQGIGRPAAMVATAHLFGLEFCAVALAPERR